MTRLVRVAYTRTAEKELKKLEKSAAQRILSKILENASQPNVLSRAKLLTGKLSGKYRYRIGDYRVIFIVTDNKEIIVLTVLDIKHRKDVYRK